MPQGRSDHHRIEGSAEGPHLSIGALAEASGIAPDTIRAWERRYGRPQAHRLPSGHRRYTAVDVRWLRRVAELLARGERPSVAVRFSDAELDRRLAGVPASRRTPPAIEKALKLATESDAEGLTRLLQRDAERFGAHHFLRKRAGPLLEAVGRRWADGELHVRHEHLLTGILDDVLRSVRTSLPAPRRAPIALLATLPDEAHGIGVQMVAVACILALVRPLVLGTGTPIPEIVEAAREAGATAVGISVSLSTGGVATDRSLADLRARLPDDVRLAVGGAGARGVRRGPRGIEYVADWPALERWLDTLVQGR
ncbi:MAG: MerR family transcriptional regulator [Planctomycetota bacterium]